MAIIRLWHQWPTLFAWTVSTETGMMRIMKSLHDSKALEKSNDRDFHVTMVVSLPVLCQACSVIIASVIELYMRLYKFTWPLPTPRPLFRGQAICGRSIKNIYLNIVLDWMITESVLGCFCYTETLCAIFQKGFIVARIFNKKTESKAIG